MTRSLRISVAAMLAITVAVIFVQKPAFCVSSDIVPQGSSLIDAFATLAKADHSALGGGYVADDFLTDRLYSRGELAQIIETQTLSDKTRLARLESDPAEAGSFRAILIELRPEFKMDGVDIDKLIRQTPEDDTSYDLQGKIEGRSNSDANQNKNGQLQSGTFGIYRGTLNGGLGPSARYAVGVSNWYQDYRRPFYAEIGTKDDEPLQEAYVELNNSHGLRFDVGRMYFRWGPGYRGAAMLNDGSAPFNGAYLYFPFSLGRHLGRNYHFEQMASIYKDYGFTSYLEARRIGYTFSKQWELYGEEGFKSNDSGSLEYTPIPFDIGQGLHLGKQYKFNYQLDFGTAYTPSPTTRFYGEFFVNDIKSPFTSGHILGFSLGQHNFVLRKVAYIAGFHTEAKTGTALTVEYDRADPFTESYRNTNAVWEHGQYDWIGLPDGPDSKEFFARIDQRLSKPISLALQYRDRKPDDNSFISPTAQDFEATGAYHFNNADTVGVSYHNYRQDPYAFAVSGESSPVQGQYAPPIEGFVGSKLRANEVDFGYSHVF